MKSSLIILSILAAVYCKQVKFLKCPGKYVLLFWMITWMKNVNNFQVAKILPEGLKPTASIESVSIDPCTTNPCQIHRGSNGTISIKFTPTTAAEHLKSTVHAKIGTWLPYALDNPDACKNSGLKCPLKPGVEALYHTSVDIKSIYPALTLFLRWEVLDQEETDVICVEIELQIV